MAAILPLDAAFGAEVRGVDLAAGADEALMRLLTGALYDHRVIVIRDQALDEESYLGFGRQWGAPIPHVLDHMRMPGYPELMTVGNTEKRDEDPKIRNGAALWHTDQSYEQVPASATMLYSIAAPEAGGETHESLEKSLLPPEDVRVDQRVQPRQLRGIREDDRPQQFAINLASGAENRLAKLGDDIVVGFGAPAQDLVPERVRLDDMTAQLRQTSRHVALARRQSARQADLEHRLMITRMSREKP